MELDPTEPVNFKVRLTEFNAQGYSCRRLSPEFRCVTYSMETKANQGLKAICKFWCLRGGALGVPPHISLKLCGL